MCLDVRMRNLTFVKQRPVRVTHFCTLQTALSMKYTIILLLLLCCCCPVRAQEEVFKPDWVLHPLSIGAAFHFTPYQSFRDSFAAAGYTELQEVINRTCINLEAYHRSGLALSATWSIRLDKGNHRQPGSTEWNSNYMGYSFCVGYNCIPQHRIAGLVVVPRIGFYWSRLKVKVSNEAGDSLLLRSAYGNEPLTEKTMRRWESGLQTGIKVSTSVCRNCGILTLINAGLELGLQRNLDILGTGYYDTKGAILILPTENKTSVYLRLDLDIGRGVWTIPNQFKKPDFN